MGLFGAGGLKSLGQSITQIIASLVGQDVTVNSLTATKNGAGALVVSGAAGTVEVQGGSGAVNLNNSGGEYRITNKPVLFGSATVFLRGLATDTGGADVAVEIVNDEALTTAGDLLLRIRNGEAGVGTAVLTVDKDGRVANPNAGNSTGAPGAATLNTPSGRSAIAAGASSVVITNSLVSATSVVLAVVQTTDATLLRVDRVVPGAGSFTIIGNAAATGNVNVGWVVWNT